MLTKTQFDEECDVRIACGMLKVTTFKQKLNTKK